MSVNGTIHFEEKEYRALEAIAKKLAFKTVDAMVNTAFIALMAQYSDLKIRPEDARKFATKLAEETAKNPDLDIDEFIKEFNRTIEIETEAVTVRVPKKLLAFVKDRRKADLEEYLSNCLTGTIAADIEADVFGDADTIKAEYDLKVEFKAYTGH